MEMSTIENGWVALENHGLKKGETIKLIFENHEELVEIEDVKKGKFHVETLHCNVSTTCTVFIYGRQINDFHIVDYEGLSMLSLSATQALGKRNERLKQEQLKTQLEALEAQANKLETMFSESKAKKEQ
jgi:hypothetical protein